MGSGAICNLQKMKNSLYTLIAALLMFASCDSYNKILTTNNIDYKYEAAKAAQLLESMLTLLKGSDKAE